MKASSSKMLNLGCGKDIKKGYLNLDYIKHSGVDLVHDLNKTPYPFNDDEFDVIQAIHILEHLESPKKVVEEMHRITKHNGKVIITVPHASQLLERFGQI